MELRIIDSWIMEGSKGYANEWTARLNKQHVDSKEGRVMVTRCTLFASLKSNKLRETSLCASIFRFVKVNLGNTIDESQYHIRGISQIHADRRQNVSGYLSRLTFIPSNEGELESKFCLGNVCLREIRGLQDCR
jgi:hypothetical protein